MPQLHSQQAVIVLRGSFNPAIFHPAWFEHHGLLRSAEAEAATISIISPQITVFSTEWLELNVTQDRFQAATSQEAYTEPLRDVVLGTFDLLSHTPVTQLGLNRILHYQLSSEETWHAVGHLLAPKENWSSILQSPGMLSLTMQGTRADGAKGYVQVTVQPSARVRPGLFISVNDHYELHVDEKIPAGTTEALEILSSRWSDAMKTSLEIAEKLAGLEEHV